MEWHVVEEMLSRCVDVEVNDEILNTLIELVDEF